jgi:hypothetical protein
MKMLLLKYQRRRFYSIQKGMKAVINVIQTPKDHVFNLFKLILYADLMHLEMTPHKFSDVTWVKWSKT